MPEVQSLEKRGYGADSTPREVEAIQSWVYMHNDNTVMYREVPVISEFQLGVFFDKIEALVEGRPNFFMIIDLTKTGGPDAKCRTVLRDRFLRVRERMSYCAVFTGKNIFLNTVAKFVMGRLGLRSFSIHRTLEEAEQAIHEAQLKAAR